MSAFLRQATAKTISIGPFISSGDGITPKTNLTLAQSDFQLSKNGGAYAGKDDVSAGVHSGSGCYTTTLNATDTAECGSLRVLVQAQDALIVWEDFSVLPANVYDSLVLGTDHLTFDSVSMADQVATQVWSQIPGGAIEVTLTQPILATGELQLVQGDDYKQVDGRALRFTNTHWPDLTGAEVVLRIDNVIDAGGVVETAASIRFDLTGEDTITLSRGRHTHAYALVATLSTGSNVTLATGLVSVTARID